MQTNPANSCQETFDMVVLSGGYGDPKGLIEISARLG